MHYDEELFCRAYDITHEGNFEGESILHLPDPIEAAKSEGIPVSELGNLTRGRAALLNFVMSEWSCFATRKSLFRTPSR